MPDDKSKRRPFSVSASARIMRSDIDRRNLACRFVETFGVLPSRTGYGLARHEDQSHDRCPAGADGRIRRALRASQHDR